jgi:hypothetical protein
MRLPSLPRPGGRTVLMILLFGWLLLLGAPSVAADSGSTNPPAQGIDGLFAPPDNIQHGNQPTIEEHYPGDAYLPFNVDTSQAAQDVFTSPVLNGGNDLMSVLASLFMGFLLILGTLTTRLVEWTFSVDLVGNAAPALAQVVESLSQNVYRPVLTILVVLAGIWFVWTAGVQRKMQSGLSGAIWTIAVVAVAGLFFLAPAAILNGIDGATQEASRTLLLAISTGDPTMTARSGNPEFAKGDAADAETRIFADRIWTTFVFQPWGQAMFGDQQATAAFGEELLAKRAGRPSNFDSDFAAHATPAQKTWYQGSGAVGYERFGIMAVSVLAMIVMSILVLALAGTIVVMQFGALLLFMFLTPVLLLGVHPGWGRGVLTRWGELLLSTEATRILATALLGAVMVLEEVAASIPNWGVRAGVQIALPVATFIFRKRLLNVLAPVRQKIRETKTQLMGEDGWLGKLRSFYGKATNRETGRQPAGDAATTSAAKGTRRAVRTAGRTAGAAATAAADLAATEQGKRRTRKPAPGGAPASPSATRRAVGAGAKVVATASGIVTTIAPEAAPVTVPLAAGVSFVAHKAGDAPAPAPSPTPAPAPRGVSSTNGATPTSASGRPPA